MINRRTASPRKLKTTAPRMKSVKPRMRTPKKTMPLKAKRVAPLRRAVRGAVAGATVGGVARRAGTTATRAKARRTARTLKKTMPMKAKRISSLRKKTGSAMTSNEFARAKKLAPRRRAVARRRK